MSSSQNTSFDSFFKAVTESPEFKSLMTPETKDTKWDSLETLENTIRSMESSVAKASDLMKWFDTTFNTDEAKSLGNSLTTGTNSAIPKTGNAEDTEQKTLLEITHFEKKPGKPWGFEAVAGMNKLKTELTESFIKPLKFKFLVEKLRQEPETVPWGKTENSEANDQNDTELKKRKLLERLYTEYEKFQISIPTGMLFYGPPWTGKTFITKKLAEELGCGFISKNMGEFGSSYLHQTTKNIREFFEWAKKASENEPILLFLDEIDSLVSARTDRVDANKAEEVSQFLQEFNALAEDAPNLIVIAATNRPDHLDSALLRSGRLDKKIYIGPPDDTAREELFKMYIETSWRPHEPLDYHELAVITTNYVSADIEAICDEVARDASQNLLDLVDEAEEGILTENDLEWHNITMEMLRETIIETPSSLKMVDMSIYEKWLEKIG